MDLSNQTALVTGGGRGIGRGCALELARRGADIVLNDRPGSEDLHATAEQIRQIGLSCQTLEADIFSRAGCEELVSAALDAAGCIDLLISNPAFSRREAFLDYDPQLFEQTIAGTLTSGFNISQLVARHMVEQRRGGRIVFISSVHAEMPQAHSVAYNAAKAGLNHLMRTIAVELSPHRINVNAIEPGWIDTPGERATFSAETIEREGQTLPMGRLGLPEEIGRAAAFLCSADADYITGAVLPVDGGFRFKDCRPGEVVLR